MDGDDAQRPSGTEPSDGRELSPSGARPRQLDPLPSGNPNASTQLSWNRQRLMAEQQRPKTIFLMSGGRIKKTQWTGVTFEELQNLYIETYYPSGGSRVWPEGGKLPAEAFTLRDPKFGIFYEAFELEDIYDGAVVEVCDPVLICEFTERKAHVLPQSLVTRQYVKTTTFHEGPCMDASDELLTELALAERARAGESAAKEDAETSTGLEYDDIGELTLRQRIFITLDEPNSSRWATLVTVLLLVLILFSTFTYCMETLPAFYEHQASGGVWWQMEATCIGIFTLEFVLRVATCPNIREYFKVSLNIVDVVAILPFYVEMLLADLKIPGLAVFRVVRLVRVFRLFKVSQGAISVFGTTMKQSSRPLYMLMFFIGIAMIVFSSLIYYAERGVYDEKLRMWMRVHHYSCPKLYRTEENDVGVFPELHSTFRVNSGHEIECERTEETFGRDLQPSEAFFMCPFSWKNGDNCQAVYEETPFESIPASFWWCLVTMTTVGYGDMYPTYWYGKLIGMVVMMFGILVIALPITVIGSNFSVVYKRVVMSEFKKKQNRKKAQHHKAKRKLGLRETKLQAADAAAGGTTPANPGQS